MASVELVPLCKAFEYLFFHCTLRSGDCICWNTWYFYTVYEIVDFEHVDKYYTRMYKVMCLIKCSLYSCADSVSCQNMQIFI
jgi:hypothetical protein